MAMQFKDLEVGQTVYIYSKIDNEWIETKISTLIGDQEPNPGRELVEVKSPWLECGWGMFDVEDLYPAPNFHTTYQMVDIVERVPDNRTYEFGIGDINNADDPYYAQTQKTRKTGQRKMVLLVKCDGCGGEFPREWMMSASLGRACTDCYDRMSN